MFARRADPRRPRAPRWRSSAARQDVHAFVQNAHRQACETHVLRSSTSTRKTRCWSQRTRHASRKRARLTARGGAKVRGWPRFPVPNRLPDVVSRRRVEKVTERNAALIIDHITSQDGPDPPHRADHRRATPRDGIDTWSKARMRRGRSRSICERSARRVLHRQRPQMGYCAPEGRRILYVGRQSRASISPTMHAARRETPREPTAAASCSNSIGTGHIRSSACSVRPRGPWLHGLDGRTAVAGSDCAATTPSPFARATLCERLVLEHPHPNQLVIDGALPPPDRHRARRLSRIGGETSCRARAGQVLDRSADNAVGPQRRRNGFDAHLGAAV